MRRLALVAGACARAGAAPGLRKTLTGSALGIALVTAVFGARATYVAAAPTTIEAIAVETARKNATSAAPRLERVVERRRRDAARAVVDAAATRRYREALADAIARQAWSHLSVEMGNGTLPPDFADVRYGPHKRQTLDFWKSDVLAGPRPAIMHVRAAASKIVRGRGGVAAMTHGSLVAADVAANADRPRSGTGPLRDMSRAGPRRRLDWRRQDAGRAQGPVHDALQDPHGVKQGRPLVLGRPPARCLPSGGRRRDAAAAPPPPRRRP